MLWCHDLFDRDCSYEQAVTKIAATHRTPVTVDEANTQLTECLQQAAAETLLKYTHDQAQAPWADDQQMRDLRSRKDQLHADNADPAAIRQVHRAIRACSRQLRNIFYDNEASRINMNA